MSHGLVSRLLRLRSPSVSALRGAVAAAAASAPPTGRSFSPASSPSSSQLTEDQEGLLQTIAKFSADVVKPLVREMDAASKMHDCVIEGCFANGFMGVEVPEEYGGPGCSFYDSALVIEGLAKTDASVSALVAIHNTLAVAPIIVHGSDDQKNKYLPHATTDWVGSFCMSEAEAGSDAFSMRTEAKRDSDDFVINGSKMYITNSEQANYFLVFANVNRAAGYRGITCFLIDRDQEGVSVGKPEDKLGIRASSTCPVVFDNVRVHQTAVLGEIGQGYKISIECLNSGRIGIAAQMLGIAQGAMDSTIPYLQERRQFNQRLFDFQGLQHQVAKVATDIEATKLLVYNAARLKDAGLPFVKEAAMAKLFAANVANKATSKCVEWLGGVGFTKEFPAEKFFRDAKIGAIYEGTSNIQMNTIAKIIDAEYKQRA